MKLETEEFPKALYVVSELSYPRYNGSMSHLIGRSTLEATVPDNGGETSVAVYTLSSISKYKKEVTKTTTIVHLDEEDL